MVVAVDEWKGLLFGEVGLVALWPQLHVTKCRTDVMARRSSSAGQSSPLVFRVDAAEVMWRIRDVLQSIAVTYDREAGAAVRFRSTAELFLVVAGNLSWVDRHSGSEEWLADLRGQVDRGWSGVDRPPNLVRLGLCGARLEDGGECPAELWHEPDAEVVQCPMCGAVVDVRRRRDEHLLRASAFRAPLSVVVEALAASGMRITVDQARKWTRREDKHGRPQLAHAAVRSDGVRLYEVGAVVRASNARRDTPRVAQR